MEERSKDEVVRREDVSRRSVIKRIGAGAAIAWSAPVLQSIAAPAFAQYGPDPECAPAQCGTFVECSSANPDCVCISCEQGGGVCVPGSTSCASLTRCNSQADCPSDSCCTHNSCCGGNPGVCVPFSLRDQCKDTAPASRRSSSRGPTIASRG